MLHIPPNRMYMHAHLHARTRLLGRPVYLHEDAPRLPLHLCEAALRELPLLDGLLALERQQVAPVDENGEKS